MTTCPYYEVQWSDLRHDQYERRHFCHGFEPSAHALFERLTSEPGRYVLVRLYRVELTYGEEELREKLSLIRG